ncbi:MAG: hypothetical protein LBS92_06830 [Candidatus Methanoplasma sp.]|jgi:hypothetical protein|nr:hypothetical protein [Candidatus Methanoplasma sp.]
MKNEKDAQPDETCEIEEVALLDSMTDEDIKAVLERFIEKNNRDIASLKSKGGDGAEIVSTLETQVQYLRVFFANILGNDQDEEELVRMLMEAEELDNFSDEVYQKYYDGLTEDEQADDDVAVTLLFEIVENYVDSFAYNIGRDAISNRKYVKYLLDDEYALQEIGKLIMSDNTLLDALNDLVNGPENPKKGKKDRKKSK